MARLENSILQGLRGKVGEIVVYEVNGKTVVRARPGKYRESKSIPQLMQRQRMVAVQQFLKGFKPLIKRFYQPDTEGKRAYGDAVAWHIKHALTGDYPDFRVDPAKARFVNGTLPNATFTQVSLEGSELKLVWETGTDMHGDAHDVLQLVVMPVDGCAAFDLDGMAQRAAGQTQVNLSNYFNGAKHLWAFFYGVRSGKVSVPVYLGLW